MNLGISAVCFILCLGRIEANTYSDPYSCYGDVCNSESSAQFCDIVYRHCRRCDDIRSDCFTRHQTFNCTSYCYEIRYKDDVEKLRVAGCKVPPHPNNGQLDFNRTRVSFNDSLTFTCNHGYVPLYIDPVRCGEFSMWNGPLPKCESSTNNAITVLTITCVIFGVCLFLSILGNIFLLNKRRLRRWLTELNEKRKLSKEKKRKSSKETEGLLDSNKSETGGQICNGTGLSTERVGPAASAPEEKELEEVISSNSDNTQSSQHPDKPIHNDAIHDDRGRISTGNNQTPTGEAHLPSANGPTGLGEERITSVDDFNNDPVNGGTSVGNIVNNFITTNVHLNVSSTPQPTSLGPSTATSEPESSPTDKQPVEETDFFGSQNGAPSQTVRAIPPENDDTSVKNVD